MTSGDKAFEALKKSLSKEVVMPNVVIINIPPAVVKKQLVELANFSLVFGFMGRVQ